MILHILQYFKELTKNFNFKQICNLLGEKSLLNDSNTNFDCNLSKYLVLVCFSISFSLIWFCRNLSDCCLGQQ